MIWRECARSARHHARLARKFKREGHMTLYMGQMWYVGSYMDLARQAFARGL
jgi:hypothetical protein